MVPSFPLVSYDLSVSLKKKSDKKILSQLTYLNDLTGCSERMTNRQKIKKTVSSILKFFCMASTSQGVNFRNNMFHPLYTPL